MPTECSVSFGVPKVGTYHLPHFSQIQNAPVQFFFLKSVDFTWIKSYIIKFVKCNSEIIFVE